MIKSDEKINLELPAKIKHNGKWYKLYDFDYYTENSKAELTVSLELGKKNGYESIIVDVSLPKPMRRVASSILAPTYLIYFRKKE